MYMVHFLSLFTCLHTFKGTHTHFPSPSWYLVSHTHNCLNRATPVFYRSIHTLLLYIAPKLRLSKYSSLTYLHVCVSVLFLCVLFGVYVLFQSLKANNAFIFVW